MTIRRLLARVLAVARKRAHDHELENEIAAHLEMAERDARESGMTAGEARRAARQRFGGIEQMKEEHRDRRGVAWLENLARDFLHGLNLLLRDPGYTAMVTGVLALGIGANVAMFSLVDALLLKPLPFADPDRIVRIWESPRPGATNSSSTLDFLDWKRMSQSLEAIAAESPVSVALTGTGDPVRLTGKAVTADYFRIFPAAAAIGRTFAPGEDEPGAAPVVVLSHSTWRTHFDSDPGILNRKAMLDGEPYRIAGVTPVDFAGGDEVQFWKPLIFTAGMRTRDFHWLSVHGRIRKGATLVEAQEELRAIHASLQSLSPAWKRDWKIVMEPLEQVLVGDGQRRSMLVSFGAVVLVLLIACANVANLVLAKGAARRNEIAIRMALGASAGRLIAQSLAESLGLVLLGGLAGLSTGWVVIRAAVPYLPASMGYQSAPAFDGRVFAFAAAVALGVSVLIGMLPFLQTLFAKSGRTGALSGKQGLGVRGASGANLGVRRAIVITEVALSLMLISGALLLFRTLFNLEGLETGIRIENVVTASIDLPPQSYPAPARAAAFYESLMERVRAIPDVEAAGLSTFLPLRWIGNGEGLLAPGLASAINVRFKRVDPGYFSTMGIPLRGGRGFTDRDHAAAPGVVVINDALAAHLGEAAGWTNVLGQSARLTTPRYTDRKGDLREVEIVGVIRSERTAGPGRPDPLVVYVPLAQAPSPGVELLVRARPGAATVLPAVRAALRQVDPLLPLGKTMTMEEVRDTNLSGVRRPAWLIGVFAGVAALLASVGLFGVLSQVVFLRRREIGIRMALGARPRQVVSGVLRSAMAMVAYGLGLGLAGAAALSSVMKNLIFGVSALDPAGLAAACGAMAFIGLAAGSLPALRAARVDPVTTLREE
ncbi:MAG: ABC transporter permease [Bryobacteraceae bacterium]